MVTTYCFSFRDFLIKEYVIVDISFVKSLLQVSFVLIYLVFWSAAAALSGVSICSGVSDDVVSWSVWYLGVNVLMIFWGYFGVVIWTWGLLCKDSCHVCIYVLYFGGLVSVCGFWCGDENTQFCFS